jgi:hypothetical protein
MRAILYIYLVVTFLNWILFWLNMNVAINKCKSMLTKEQLEDYKNRKRNLASDILLGIKSLAISAVPIVNVFLLFCYLFRNDFFEYKIDSDVK